MTSGNVGVQQPVRRTAAHKVGILLVAAMLSAPAAARADVGLDWNAIAAQTAITTSPFNQARIAPG